VFECHSQIVELCASVPGADQVVVMGAPLPPCDLQAPLMSLPAIFGTKPATIPANVPYLKANPDRQARWRQELHGVAGFKVGIAWQGNPANPKDRYRSLPLAQLAPLAAVKNVTLLSLQ